METMNSPVRFRNSAQLKIRTLLQEEVSSVTAKSWINPSLTLQLLNSGLWILAHHVKLERFWGQESVNLALGNVTSCSNVLPPLVHCWRLYPFWLSRAQTLSDMSLGDWESKQHSRRRQDVTFDRLPNRLAAPTLKSLFFYFPYISVSGKGLAGSVAIGVILMKPRGFFYA